MLAYDYPLLGLFWTFLWFFIWIAWIVLLFRVFADLFRNHEMSGWGKALWSIFVILVPFLGVLVYLIAHGHDMQKRDIETAKAQELAFPTAGPRTSRSMARAVAPAPPKTASASAGSTARRPPAMKRSCCASAKAIPPSALPT